METSLLQQIGLTEQQITIYNALLTHGPQKAGALTKKTDLKRGLIYKVLDELSTMGLVQKDEKPGTATVFVAQHPQKLKDLITEKTHALTRAQKMFDDTLGDLVSAYNLSYGKPGISFYEGRDGVEKVLADSLTAKETILSYVDIEAIEKNIPHINKAYSQKRDRLNIHKRGIVIDSPYAQKVLSTYYSTTTTSRLISVSDAPPFTATMQIYNGKVSYITFKEALMIGIIIQDQSIYDLHKYLFEFVWRKARSVFPKE